MVRGTLLNEKTLGVLALGLGVFVMLGCASKPSEVTPNLDEYYSALERVKSIPSMKPDSKVEEDALARFREFYLVYSVDAIKEGIRSVYAENAWFGDPFHIVEGIDDLEHYFVVMAEPVETCTFIVDDIQRSGDDFYARWKMTLESKVAKGQQIEAIGLSHVRFDEQGLIVFQQDYWDTSAMFDRLPVVGYWTRLVKTRLAKGLEK